MGGRHEHNDPSRRAFLQCAAGAALAAHWNVPTGRDKMIFVLVHPAWLGGWCWRKAAPLLRAHGHEVYTPTLTGLGERAHLIHRDVGLATHVEDIVSVLECEDLRNVILVGNSSGGMVITGVAERAPERLAQLVYLDAFVPGDGQSLVDLLPGERRAALARFVEAEGEGWLLPRFAPQPWDAIVRDAWGVASAEDRAWMAPRLRPTPYRHFTDALRLGNPATAKIGRTYVRCLYFQPGRHAAFDGHAAMARETPGWRYRGLEATHLPYVTHPAELADVLVGLGS
jgi:pimeloyl-ACP methyl ester carboxylesterase